MTAFSIRDIDDLKPQERRYDVPIEDDFVVSVLPNGIKTWVYVHEQDGRLQRRTLGVYPDMGSEAARASLGAARQTRRALQEARERSVQSTAGRVGPGASRSQSPRSVALAAAATVAVLLAAGAYLGVREGRRSSVVSRDEQPSVPTSQSLQSERSASNGVGPAPTADSSGEQDTTLDSAGTAPSDDSTADIKSPSPPSVAPTASVPVASSPAPERSAQTTGVGETAVPPTSAPAREMPTPIAPGVAAHDTHVARAVLTSDVVRREPVDSIGPEIRGDPDEVQQVYFFTELRGLRGQSLRYRWLRNGRLEAEVPLAVGMTWRWRSYSRKDLLPDQTGDWRVQLVDEAEGVLAESDFVYRNDPPGTQSADAN